LVVFVLDQKGEEDGKRGRNTVDLWPRRLRLPGSHRGRVPLCRRGRAVPVHVWRRDGARQLAHALFGVDHPQHVSEFGAHDQLGQGAHRRDVPRAVRRSRVAQMMRDLV
jgi:hypothetical protein